MMQILEERNALSGRTPISARDRLSVTAASASACFSLRIAPAAREQAAHCFGSLLAKIGELTFTGERIALCLGPDEWFLMAPAADADTITARFADDLHAPHSLVDIGHREVGIEVRGAEATLALSAVSALDLAAMPSPSATRTIFDKAQVVLIKHAPDYYRIEVWQSFADHVWGLLEAVASEIDLDI
jgi:sarcosine oxidase subunit gamma